MKISVLKKLKDGRAIKDLTLEEVAEICKSNGGCGKCELSDHSIGGGCIRSYAPQEWGERWFTEGAEKGE